MNKPLLEQLNTDAIEVVIHRVEAAEIDEMWSYVGKKKAPRWLWHALDHQTGKVLAYVLGRRKDAVLRELKQLLEPFGINRFYTDHWGSIGGNWKRRNTSLANGKPSGSSVSSSRFVCGSNG